MQNIKMLFEIFKSQEAAGCMSLPTAKLGSPWLGGQGGHRDP